MNRYQIGLLAVVAMIVAAAIFAASQPSADTSTGAPAASGATSADLVAVSQRPPAPAFAGLASWLNSPPLTIAALRGQVVLIDFWTYSCVNCIRTLPHLQGLQAKYGDKGLIIIGMHSPEFDFEMSQANVAAAVKRLNITWPVALDSKMATWRAWSNQYWPAEYLIDRQGRIAYFHAGEGDYDKTERAIVSLLGSGAAVTPEPMPAQDALQTPELYAGSGRSDGRIGLHGPWQDHVQYVESTGPATVKLVFHAREVYIVAEAAGSQPLSVTVTLDGKPVPDPERGPDLGSNGTLTVGRSDLFLVLTGTGGGDRTIVLGVPSGFRLYTFTFG